MGSGRGNAHCCNGLGVLGSLDENRVIECSDAERTPANRHISFPSWTSVRTASSPTHVTSLFPSGVTATGPPVYRGAITLPFLNLMKHTSTIQMHAKVSSLAMFSASSSEVRP